MASDQSSEFDDFQTFMTEHLNGSTGLTLEESLERFRNYQRELVSAREKLRESEEQSARGESRPLNADALKSEIRDRLTAEGVTD